VPVEISLQFNVCESMKKNTYKVFGIRHHGPGSAKNLIEHLERMKPDFLLVEGPQEANELVRFVAMEGMTPPVALLIYAKADPRFASFYPFAEFSPEWQALKFAVKHQIPSSFMDLPQTNQLAFGIEKTLQLNGDSVVDELPNEAVDHLDYTTVTNTEVEPDISDPLGWLARQAGYADGESWWESVVEQRLDTSELFEMIEKIMTELRAHFQNHYSEEEQQRERLREAAMRRKIRNAINEGFTNIAVICGAWHVPALTVEESAASDNKLLRKLPRTKVDATWVPWTYGRLARKSGYGAGVTAPGWYHHLWECRKSDSKGKIQSLIIRWIARVAGLLRSADLDASSAQVIEAVRLAESLASIRGLPFPGLHEISEATQAVLCFGESAPLTFVRDKMLISDRIGTIPSGVPAVPLQRDIEKHQKSLRLKPSTVQRELDLDLRSESGLAKSRFLHRLNVLDISWGEVRESGSGKKGTFHEIWLLEWAPELSLSIIEAALWGNTVESAATSCAIQTARDAKSVSELALLANKVILAELGIAVQPIASTLKMRAAEATDVIGLVSAIPPLVRVLRYGSVRKSDSSMIQGVVFSFITQISVGFITSCLTMDEEVAQDVAGKTAEAHQAILLIEEGTARREWLDMLLLLVETERIHSFLRGKVCRLLMDSTEIDSQKVADMMSLAVSPGNETSVAAAWIEGFLSGSGMLLIHDASLWQILDKWILSQSTDQFNALLPLLRRTFSSFSVPERQLLGKHVSSSSGNQASLSSKETMVNTSYKAEWGDEAVKNILIIMGANLVETDK